MCLEDDFAVIKSVDGRAIDLNDSDNLIRKSVDGLTHNTLSLSCMSWFSKYQEPKSAIVPPIIKSAWRDTDDE